MNIKSVTFLMLSAGWCALAQPHLGTPLWTYQGPPYPAVCTSVAVGLNGTVYVAFSGANLYAVTNSGSTASNKWASPIVPSGSPAIASDATLYLVNQGGLTALNPDGSQKWFYSASEGYGSAAIGPDNTIYFLAGSSLFAISPSGAKVWQSDVGTGKPLQSPCVGPDGIVYAALFINLHAVSPDGSKLWTASLSPLSAESPAINSAGSIVAASGSLYAFSSRGTNIWTSDDGGFQGSPVIGVDGGFYVSGWRRSLCSVTSGGARAWSVLGGPPYGNLTSPAIDAGGTIWYCVSNSLWAINPQGQIKWNFTSSEFMGPGDVANASPVIGPEGTVYAALGSRLYAFASGTNGPANSAWPMYRQNARHTGKIEKPWLAPPRKRADANFQLQLYGQVSNSLTIESSTNLNTWTSLTSFVATTVPMDVVDTQATNSPSKFYRAFGPP